MALDGSDASSSLVVRHLCDVFREAEVDREAAAMSQSQSDQRGCRVYWGSHACYLSHGHEGPHLCECAHEDDDPAKPLLPHMNEADNGNVGRPPYYGPETRFYGEDAEALGLPLVSDE